MDTLGGDLRYALRGLRNQPGFAALAILALALGIGSATSIFSVVYNVVLNPFPYRAANRIAMIQVHDLSRSDRGGRPAYRPAEFLALQQQNHVFEGVIGNGTLDVLYTTPEGTERLQGDDVTGDAFEFLGIPALYGRGLMPADAKPGAPLVFVMSYKMWVKHCHSDRAVLGRSFILNDQPRTLVGIMPPRFTYFGADLWMPHDPDPAAADAARQFLFLHGRIRPGLTLAQVESDIDVIAHQQAKLYPDLYPEKFNIHAEILADSVVGQFRNSLMMLMAAVGLLLLIACTNVANMLLARATARGKEIAVRAALGASRWRLVRQLLIESSLLGFGGMVVGCGFAWAGLRFLVQSIPENAIPSEAVIELNVPVLLFCLGAAALTTVLAGLAPAIHATAGQLADPIKEGSKGAGGSSRHGRLRQGLVIAEIALSVVLLAGAGLMMRTMAALQSVDLGLNPDNILVARLPLPKDRYKTAAARKQFFSQVLARLGALPGVVAATETSTLPPYGGIGSEADVPGITHAEKWQSIYQLCSEGYFPTLGLRLIRGRVLSPADVDSARKVAVVNQTLARKFFGNADPIGRTLVLKDLAKSPDPVPNPNFEIVGVISDAKNQGPQEPSLPEAFIPYTVTASYERGVLVRTAADPLLMLNAVRKEIWSVDRGVALTLTGSLKGYLQSFSYSGPEFTLFVLACFAAIGFVLVAIGTYSVVSYAVNLQTREIGIRMALGADRPQVFQMVMRRSGAMVAFGLSLGLLASLGVNRLIASQLWGVTPYDPATLASVAILVAAMGLIACGVPARRATRVDPGVSLRYE